MGHEGIHSKGHESRLKRDLSGAFGSRGYAREELVAELGSVLIGQRLQIGCELAHHAAYLQSWISVLRESPKVLLQVISEALQAVDLLCPEAPCPEEPAGDPIPVAPSGGGAADPGLRPPAEPLRP